MGLADAVHEVRSDRAHEVAVHRAEGAALEVPLVGRVVRQRRVGVLEVGDHDEPVVDAEVRDEVVLDDAGEATVEVAEEGDERDHADEESVREENLGAVALVEDERRRLEVVGPRRVPQLTGGVAEEVRGPTEELLDEEPVQAVDRRVLEELVEFNVGRDAELLAGRGGLVVRGGTGDKDLVAGHVAGRGVVLGVRDAPRVVRDQNERVEEKTHRVVDGLGRREGLVTALVSCEMSKCKPRAFSPPIACMHGEYAPRIQTPVPNHDCTIQYVAQSAHLAAKPAHPFRTWPSLKLNAGSIMVAA